MPYYVCWQQLLVMWIHYCVSMGSVFHFYKVNLNIHCCVSQDKSHCIIWVNVASPTSIRQLQGRQGTVRLQSPFGKTVYP